MKRTAGFTLIELLVVIAIIAILAAILFPVFAQARDKARSASCQSNLKQFSLSVLMYAQDYDETFPIWERLEQAKPLRVTRWDQVILPYVKNIEIYHCPTQKRWAGAVSTYGYNRQLGELVDRSKANPFTAIPAGYPLAGVPSPAQVILLYDADPEGLRPFASGNAHPWFRVASRAYHLDNTFSQRHGDGDNIAFTDGHVKWYQTQSINDLFPGKPLIFETWTAQRISYDRTYQGS
jgi:prepilin-type N-terminal cleavage/methylation domain-containing protein/prepilin-type processing-associated H-X9-DG protein